MRSTEYFRNSREVELNWFRFDDSVATPIIRNSFFSPLRCRGICGVDYFVANLSLKVRVAVKAGKCLSGIINGCTRQEINIERKNVILADEKGMHTKMKSNTHDWHLLSLRVPAFVRFFKTQFEKAKSLERHSLFNLQSRHNHFCERIQNLRICWQQRIATIKIAKPTCFRYL